MNSKTLIQLKLFFSRFTKIPYFIYALTGPILIKLIYLEGLDTKKVILEGRRFRGVSDEKMRRIWLGLEIVVAGILPFIQLNIGIYFEIINQSTCISWGHYIRCALIVRNNTLHSGSNGSNLVLEIMKNKYFLSLSPLYIFT